MRVFKAARVICPKKKTQVSFILNFIKACDYLFIKLLARFEVLWLCAGNRSSACPHHLFIVCGTVSIKKYGSELPKIYPCHYLIRTEKSCPLHYQFQIILAAKMWDNLSNHSLAADLVQIAVIHFCTRKKKKPKEKILTSAVSIIFLIFPGMRTVGKRVGVAFFRVCAVRQ